MTDPCVRCGKPAVHLHHRKRRSQGGDNSEANLVPLCVLDHQWVHDNPKEAYEVGLLVHSWDDPAEVPIVYTKPIDPAPILGKGTPQFHEPTEGETCELCKRRVPHKRKATSPTTRPLAYRIPEEEYDAHLETIDSVAELLGIKESKYHRYNTVNAGLLALLQGARLTEEGA